MQNIEEVKVTGFTFSYREALAVSEFIDKILTFYNKAHIDYDCLDDILSDVKTELDRGMATASAHSNARLMDEEFSVNLRDWIDP